MREWYPKLVKMLPSEGYEAPTQVSITFSADMQGVAATGGTRVRCAAAWFRQNLQGEAKGAVVHELVHVVQNYGIARRNNPERHPDSRLAGRGDLRLHPLVPVRARDARRRDHQPQHRPGPVRRQLSHQRQLPELGHRRPTTRTSSRSSTPPPAQGKYNEDLWKTATGHTVQELGDEWKASLEKKIAEEAAEAAKMNTLTDEEKAAGWKLLFNGTDLTGWHNFRREDVRPGWQVKDGVLVCADPHNAGDLCTNDQYDWFELQLEYNISPAGNSGIMYHVTDEARSAWATGPEFQLEDNAAAADPVRCGWLYALYQPPTDPNTGKTLDATKPAGQWNHIRLLISPTKCEHVINGVTYFDYVLGSEDFQQRVAKSKFARMPLFAKPSTGYIALQGDHGQVSFRNIKIRPIQARETKEIRHRMTKWTTHEGGLRVRVSDFDFVLRAFEKEKGKKVGWSGLLPLLLPSYLLIFFFYLRPRPRPLRTPSARRLTSSEMFMSRIFWARVLAACLSVAAIRPARSTVARAASVFRASFLMSSRSRSMAFWQGRAPSVATACLFSSSRRA